MTPSSSDVTSWRFRLRFVMSRFTQKRCFDRISPRARRTPSTKASRCTAPSSLWSTMAKSASACCTVSPASSRKRPSSGVLEAASSSSRSSLPSPLSSICASCTATMCSSSSTWRSTAAFLASSSLREVESTFSVSTPASVLRSVMFVIRMKQMQKAVSHGLTSMASRAMSGQPSSVMSWKSVKSVRGSVPNHDIIFSLPVMPSSICATRVMSMPKM
mmetsp:Transcript_7329/g.22963  ORF Transcript_7329/g.22963 Transcript_7329/m.22963 type:complete len:217 (+) Transcript_7329:346-996(+)